MPEHDRLEIHLEELGQHSWVKALLNTVSSSNGSAQFRFVARAPGHDADGSADRVVGATFPMMRGQDLDNVREPNAWVETARVRLHELDRQLLDDGWHRAETRGRHWWSLAYTGRSR
jgi:hypothetical protein